MTSEPRAAASQPIRWPVLFLILGGAVTLWAWPFFKFIPYDYDRWMLPWWQHIVGHGRIEVFSKPFSNYTPTYLYLLSATTLLNGDLRPLLAIKLLSAVGMVWLAYAIWQLLRTTNAPRPLEGAAWSLFLPTVVVNAPILAQADAFWLAPSVLSVAAAIKQRMLVMVLWAGLAFAFKAQAVFLSPFVISTLIRHRPAIWVWFAPFFVYVAAMLPATALGWPVADIASIYVRQAQWHPDDGTVFVSNAANLWTVFKLIAFQTATRSFWIGYLAALLTGGVYVFYFHRRSLSVAQTVASAALSATLIPFLLPGMHERFLALGELLAFCLAWTSRDRNSVIAAGLMQMGLIAAFAGWQWDQDAVAVGGCFFVLGSIILLVEAMNAQFRAPAPRQLAA